ncbi:MAG: hypothetical protein ABWZ27_01910 [Aestuariivirgaceae bacterium]
MDIRAIAQPIVAAFHSLEQRFGHFRQGAAARLPDFTEFRHKVAAFFARLPERRPNPAVNVQPPQARQQTVQQAATQAMTIEGMFESLDKPSLFKRATNEPQGSPAPVKTSAVPEPTIRADEPAPETPAKIVSTISDAASIISDAVERAASTIATGAETVLGVVQQTAEAIANSAKDAISAKLEVLTGSPPPLPPPPPPVVKADPPKQTEEERAKHQDYSDTLQRTRIECVGSEAPRNGRRRPRNIANSKIRHPR